jgi:hypothetical protein
MLGTPALLKSVGGLGLSLVVEPPLHDVAEVAGSGTAIMGLKPVPPASVASSGSAPSLNAGPLIIPGPGGGAASLKPGAIAGVNGLQVPASADVPNGAIADVPIVVPGKPLKSMLESVELAMPVIGHVVMPPRTLPVAGIRLPKLGRMASRAPTEGIGLVSPIGAVDRVVGAPGTGTKPTCATAVPQAKRTRATAAGRSRCIKAPARLRQSRRFAVRNRSSSFDSPAYAAFAAAPCFRRRG